MRRILLFLVVVATAWGDSDSDWLTDLKQKVPQAPVCGNDAQDRIFGGEVAGMTDFPWTVLLEYMKPGNERGYHCAGSLINDRYVLTAAHCVESVPDDWSLENVVLGEWNIETDPDCDEHKTCSPPVSSVKIEKTIVHPSYRRVAKNKHDNIALLRLATPVKFTDFVSPICLPLDPLQWNQNYTGQHFTAAGWGRQENGTASSIKRKVDLPFRPFNKCKELYEKKGVRLNEKLHMCAGVEGKATCRGDSGSALMYYDVSQAVSFWYAAGVNSFGDAQCGSSSPEVYSNVENYLQWIAENIEK